MKIPVSALFVILVIAVSSYATIYNVGPGQPLTSIGAVPWATLQPGDTVQIHWRAEGYAEKWVIGGFGCWAVGFGFWVFERGWLIKFVTFS